MWKSKTHRPDGDVLCPRQKLRFVCCQMCYPSDNVALSAINTIICICMCQLIATENKIIASWKRNFCCMSFEEILANFKQHIAL